ncbi:MAG: hypothetical protein MRECE_26c020 [Mycoplasmataceae bacterium CE_OT135]|nr:MAG: hypothetical protein MRECE_26c020 [Mycoplasmataceae bacterium CE_OT135]
MLLHSARTKVWKIFAGGNKKNQLTGNLSNWLSYSAGSESGKDYYWIPFWKKLAKISYA